MSEYLASTMDAAVERVWHNARITMLACDSMSFPQRWPMSTPPPYKGIEYPANGYFLQGLLYIVTLLEPKLGEPEWVKFVLSPLTGTARQWAKSLVTIKHSASRAS